MSAPIVHPDGRRAGFAVIGAFLELDAGAHIGTTINDGGDSPGLVSATIGAPLGAVLGGLAGNLGR